MHLNCSSNGICLRLMLFLDLRWCLFGFCSSLSNAKRIWSLSEWVLFCLDSVIGLSFNYEVKWTTYRHVLPKSACTRSMHWAPQKSKPSLTYLNKSDVLFFWMLCVSKMLVLMDLNCYWMFDNFDSSYAGPKKKRTPLSLVWSGFWFRIDIERYKFPGYGKCNV